MSQVAGRHGAGRRALIVDLEHTVAVVELLGEPTELLGGDQVLVVDAALKCRALVELVARDRLKRCDQVSKRASHTRVACASSPGGSDCAVRVSARQAF